MAKSKTKRGKRRENRHQRRHEQHAGGGSWTTIKIPDGMEVFKPEAGKTYHVDVIPYVVGKGNKAADPGDEYFELSYSVYNDLGIEEKKYVAIGDMLGVPDPVAEHLAQLRKENAEWDDMKPWTPKTRQLMLWYVHEQADKGVQLYEGAYGTVGELLDDEIKAADEADDYIQDLDDPEGGATLVIRFKAQSIGQSNPWVRAASIKFEEREDGLADPDLLDHGVVLEDLLKYETYDSLKNIMNGVPTTPENDDDGDDEEAEEAPAKKPARKPRKAKEEEAEEPPKEKPKKPAAKKTKAPPTAEALGIVKGAEVEHDEHGVCTVIRIGKDGLSVTIMTEDDEVVKGVAPIDLEPVEEAAQTPPPKEKAPEGKRGAASAKTGRGKSKSAAASDAETKSPSKAEPEEDEDWDDDWEDD